MMEPKLTFSLIGAPEEGVWQGDEFQRELRNAEEELRAGGAQVTPEIYVRKSVGLASLLTGKFLISLGAPAFAFLGAWLQARYGRKVRIKIGDVEAEASTLEEVNQLLEKAKAFRATKDEKP